MPTRAPSLVRLPSDTISPITYGTVFGDTDSAIATGYIGGADLLTSVDSWNNSEWDIWDYTAVGDAALLAGTGAGGNDTLVGGVHRLVGTAWVISELWGNLSDVWGEAASVTLVGDALSMQDSSRGGSDRIQGGNQSSNLMYGDALAAAGTSSLAGGNDTIKGADSFSLNSDPLRDSGVDEDGSGGYWVTSNLMFGDFGSQGLARGGNDVLTGGSSIVLGNSGVRDTNGLFGDSETMSAGAVGGHDTLTGGNATILQSGPGIVGNCLAGDARFLNGGQGGNDVLKGGNLSVSGSGSWGGLVYNILAGDAVVLGASDSRCGNDLIVGGSASNSGITTFKTCHVTNQITGDAWMVGIADAAGIVFGKDTIQGGNADGQGTEPDGVGGARVQNHIYGDLGGTLESTRLGVSEDHPLHRALYGNDSLIGGNALGNNEVENLLVGDAPVIDGYSRGGDDVLKGGSFFVRTSYNILCGDSETDLTNHSTGGNDTLSGGGSGGNMLYGDAVDCIDAWSVGGNDRLTGAGPNSNNGLFGDADVLSGHSLGGNDLLTGGGAGSLNLLYGDAVEIDAGSVGGKDTLVSGAGQDDMWGDARSLAAASCAAADRFVFKPDNDQDTIHDFQTWSGDVIDLAAFRRYFGSYAAMVQQGRVEDDGAGNTVLHLDIKSAASDLNTVTIVGVLPSELQASDFAFR